MLSNGPVQSPISARANERWESPGTSAAKGLVGGFLDVDLQASHRLSIRQVTETYVGGQSQTRTSRHPAGSQASS